MPSFDADHLPRISVDQAPKTGHNYPFVGSSDLSGIIHDLYLAYGPADINTPADYNVARFAYPLRITKLQLPEVVDDLTWEEISLLWETWDTDWEDSLSGPVTRVAPIIKDANNVTVFDPVAESARYHVVPWGADRLVMEWLTADKVLRLVVTSSGIALYEDAYVPTAAILDPRTYTQVNGGIHSVFGGGIYTAPTFKIVAGYNIRIDVSDTVVTEGTRRSTTLAFNAVAGAGLGKTPGCDGTVDYLTTINKQAPDASGRFFLSTDDCYRLQVPVSISAGSAHTTPNALAIYSACDQVCPPVFYVNTYKAVSRLWDRWQDIANTLKEARDDYHSSVERWLAERDCRRNNPAKLMVTQEPNCRVAVSGIYCNAGKKCLIPLEMRFKFEMIGGSPSSTPTLCGPAFRYNSSLAIEESVPLNGAWPLFYTKFDYADPQTSSSVRFRLCIPGCSGKQVKVTMTVHSPTVGDAEESVILGGPSNGSLYDTRASLNQTVPLNSSPPVTGGVCSC